MKVLVTGGCGFIGSAVVRHLIRDCRHAVVNVDCLTYAASPAAVASVDTDPTYSFARVDVCDGDAVAAVFRTHQPDAVMHLAAESHVDRSIDGPGAFIQTNVVGTFTLLQEARRYFESLDGDRRGRFRFHHISTDEVFGALGLDDPAFSESTPYDPRSPYSASKAASDHLVRAWGHTYGLPVVLTNCSNNYGPFHFPEKLIPLMILKGLVGERLPVYGRGDNIRDWLFVEDHARALVQVLQDGRIGETYAIGGSAERSNLQVVHAICDLLDELAGPLPPTRDQASDGADAAAQGRRGLIGFVTDRPGHDFRYAMNTDKIGAELGWRPREDFESGLRKTVQWYLDNEAWWGSLAPTYSGQRLGLAQPTAVGS